MSKISDVQNFHGFQFTYDDTLEELFKKGFELVKEDIILLEEASKMFPDIKTLDDVTINHLCVAVLTDGHCDKNIVHHITEQFVYDIEEKLNSTFE